MSGRSHDIDRIFWEASQIASSEERRAFLDRACAGDTHLRQRVDSLLTASARAEGFLERPFGCHTAHLDSDQASPGARIGPYTLLREIGEGGMGLVYMARKEGATEQVVALKLIRPGMDSRQVVQRFEAERQALARMDHPNIARVLDAGSTESGRPYFVMDLVAGIPVTHYCDQERLSLPDRLSLVVSVCLAAQHAHQKGIIHRDLKPGNVLVSTHAATSTRWA